MFIAIFMPQSFWLFDAKLRLSAVTLLSKLPEASCI